MRESSASTEGRLTTNDNQTHPPPPRPDPAWQAHGGHRFYVGSRDADAAQIFISDLASRLANRVQLTSDGHKPYLQAVEQSFGADVDYAMLIKHYGAPVGALGRYSPGECTGAELRRVEGCPDLAHVSTSYVERANLTLRMGSRRFTRLTNGFSKKVENHAHSVAIHTMHYNFVRIHQTLRCTPAMAAEVTAELWELTDMVKVLEYWENNQGQKSNRPTTQNRRIVKRAVLAGEALVARRDARFDAGVGRSERIGSCHHASADVALSANPGLSSSDEL